jgi:hypothetical protein
VLEIWEHEMKLITWKRAHGRSSRETAVEDEVVSGMPPASSLAGWLDAEPFTATRGVVVGGCL